MLPAGDRYYQLINVFIRKKAKVREFFSRYHMIFIFFPAEAMLQGRGLIWKIQRTNSLLLSKSEKFTVTSFHEYNIGILTAVNHIFFVFLSIYPYISRNLKF